jgi:hypothetical protein
MLLTQSAYKIKVKMTYEPRHTGVGSRGTAPPIPNVTIRWDWAVKFTLRTFWTPTTVLWIQWTGSWMDSQIRFGHCGQEKHLFASAGNRAPISRSAMPHSSQWWKEIRLAAVTKRNIPKPLPTALDIWTTSNVKAVRTRKSFEAPHISVRVWGE